MKTALVVLALTAAIGFAKNAPVEKQGTDSARTSVHGGTLTEKAHHVFETAVRADQVRVYVFDGEGSPLPVKKLKGKVTLVPAKGKKVELTLKPTSAGKDRQAYLAASHEFDFSKDGSKLELSLRGLGEKGKTKAAFEVSLAETPVVSYVCPMHKNQSSEDPGRCGKCKMALKRNEQPAKKPAASAYACPMKCEGKKTYDESGRCPVCRMSLRKVATGGHR